MVLFPNIAIYCRALCLCWFVYYSTFLDLIRIYSWCYLDISCYSFLMLVGLVTILLIISLWLLVTLISHLFLLSSYSHLPGPPPVSFFSGHVTSLLEVMRREGTAYSLRMEWSIQFPHLYIVWLFNTPQVGNITFL